MDGTDHVFAEAVCDPGIKARHDLGRMREPLLREAQEAFAVIEGNLERFRAAMTALGGLPASASGTWCTSSKHLRSVLDAEAEKIAADLAAS